MISKIIIVNSLIHIHVSIMINQYHTGLLKQLFTLVHVFFLLMYTQAIGMHIVACVVQTLALTMVVETMSLYI
jgi:hypothetical protein